MSSWYAGAETNEHSSLVNYGRMYKDKAAFFRFNKIMKLGLENSSGITLFIPIDLLLLRSSVCYSSSHTSQVLPL